MGKLVIALVSMAWLGTAFGQGSASRANEVEQATQSAMQQRDYGGEQGKLNKAAKKPKLTDKQKEAEVSAMTGQAMQQRDYGGEQGKLNKAVKYPKLTNKQKEAEVSAMTGQAMQQRDYSGEPAAGAKPAAKP